VRRVARALLPHNLPHATSAEIDALIEHLTTGYESHDYPITGGELRELGVAVSDGERSEMEAALDVWDKARRLFEAADRAGVQLVSVVQACAGAPPVAHLESRRPAVEPMETELRELGAV